MGEDVILTEIFNDGSGFYPGDGAGDPATFTAPVTGKYYIEFYVFTTTTSALSVISIVVSGDVSTARTYQLDGSFAGDGSGSFHVYSTVAEMTALDVATFSITGTSGGTNDWKVLGDGGDNLNSTRISGFLIAGSSNVIEVLDGDSGSASGTTVAIQGGYNITTAAAANVLEVNVSGTTNHAVQVGNATNSLTSLALGNANQVLTSNGAAADPSFEDSSAFFAYLPSSVTVATGSPAYDLGSTVALVEDFDIGTNFDPGNGAGIGCFFTAPRDGVYEFTLSAFVTTAFPNNFPNFIITRPGRVYQGRGSTFVSNQFTIQTELSSTDVVTFSIEHVGLPFSPYDIEGNGGGSVEYATFVSGKRIG